MSFDAEFDAFALLFEYPAGPALPRIEAACRHLEAALPGHAAGARGLRALLEAEGPGGAEEHFTQVFDVNAARSLEMGWHLYGEDYARGAFLVQMRGLLRGLGVEEGSELPDHLPTLLCALGRLPAGKAAVFSTSWLQPALSRMAAGFEGRETPYGDLVAGLLAALEVRYGPTSAEPPAPPAQATPYDVAPSPSSCPHA